MKPATTPLAVLVSGGLDSAILLGEACRTRPAVFPLYVRTGSFWEAVEQTYLDHFQQAMACPHLKPLQVLEMPVAELYGEHWSLSGEGVPDAASTDDAVFLPGRNVILLSKALIWCHLHGVPELALAPLASNPFPDATPEFFAGFAKLVSQAIGGCVAVIRPYAEFSKAEVIRRGLEMPLQHTFSCIRPVQGKHCGQCNKCSERQAGFRAAGMADPTAYVD